MVVVDVVPDDDLAITVNSALCIKSGTSMSVTTPFGIN